VTVAQHIYLGLTAGLLGSMLLFAVVVTPTVFQTLDRDTAGKYLQRLFPRFHWWGIALSAISLAPAVYLANGLPLVLSTLTAALFLFARLWLSPRINASRGAEPDTRFRRLHKLSVRLFLVQIILLCVALYAAGRTV